MNRSMEKVLMTGASSRAATRKFRSAAGAVLLVALAAAPAAGAPPPERSSESAWVSVSYRELLDPEAITRSGIKLVDALRRKASRAELQPFLDPYSSLLGYAVQMLSGADPAPQVSLAERYPAGTAQPAWAAVLREGRYFVSADGQGRARVFAPGNDPRVAYRLAYSLLRHPLAAAVTPGIPLQVEVFCYRNDFATAELRLNPVPYRFRTSSFPPRGRPLDLEELEAFFRKGGQLEGAEIVPDGGLVLYASQAQQQSLGGAAVTLADLAVAYRAVFHAGEAEAFVSLDPNADPTQATVNFGGLLEDTRFGKAVLAADVRFKTICSGFDPTTFADIRENTRRAVPSFMSISERRMTTNPAVELTKWVIARFWYYPDSCGVESDDGDRLAAITRTQLTADVERVDAGAGAPRGRKQALPAFFRENIRDLNANYASYAAVFPEFRDLSSAARLMALAAWLGRVRPEGLDLDGLLAVTLPPESTPRTVPQLLSADILQFPGTAPPDPDYVFRNDKVLNLTPELNKKVSEFFGDPRHLAEFLALKAGKEAADASKFAAAAERLYPTVQDKPVRDLLRTTRDLHAFLRSYAARILGEIADTKPGESARDGKRLEEIRAELAALPSGSAGSGGADDPRRRRLEAELRDIVRKYHAQGPGAGMAGVVATQYTGGVSLAPRLFSVKKSANRPALEQLKAKSGAAGTNSGAAGWIRSEEKTAARKARPQPLPPDVTPEEIAPARTPARPAMTSIAVPKTATPAGSALVGRLGEGGRIVFTRAAR